VLATLNADYAMVPTRHRGGGRRDRPIHAVPLRPGYAPQSVSLRRVARPTELYLGYKQRFRDAVNDHIGLETDPPS
jgi:hypothetical protein